MNFQKKVSLSLTDAVWWSGFDGRHEMSFFEDDPGLSLVFWFGFESVEEGTVGKE